ncbi:MAG: ABC transporter permease [Oscillospiraceae bacterium]|nr:ABC transporter permease [Oscillospiraceae bacterium]
MSTEANTKGVGKLLGGSGLRTAWSSYSFMFVFAVIFGVYLIINIQAVNWGALSNILRHSSVIGVVALAMGMIILTGDIDLSVGSTVALVGGVSVLVFNATGSIPLTFLFGILGGAVCGLANGFLVSILKVPSFIATLATMLIFRSIASWLMTAHFQLSMFRLNHELSQYQTYFRIGNGNLFGLPILFWVFLAVTVVMVYITTSTKFGKSVFAVGSNEKAARLAGINVKVTRMLVFTVAGALTGLAAVMLSGQMSGILASTAGRSYELYAIAAVVLGGISMTGGKGKMLGIIFGVVTFTIVDNIIMALRFNPLINDTFSGLILLAAILLQLAQKRGGTKA